MKILSDDAIHSKLLLNLPVYIEGIGNFHAPKLEDIVDVTEEYYNMSLSAIFFDKRNLEEDLEEYSNFQVLLSIINQDDYFRELFFHGLNLHINNLPFVHPTGLIFFGEFSDVSILTEEKLDYIKKLIRIANNLPEQKQEEEYKAGNEMARKLIEQIKKNRERRNKITKQPINLHSIMSAVGWKAQSFEFISKLTIYQLYDGFYRLRVIDNYDHNLRGIYSGTVDATKIKLSDIDWANIIK